MKRFAFSLQYLLDAHSAREQAAEQALQNAIQQRTAAEHALQAAKENRQREVAAMERLSGMVKRSDYATHLRNMDTYDREMRKREVQYRQRDEQVGQCRATLQKEQTARLQLEKLSEREREEWIGEYEKMEQKIMDETAVGRWHRQEMMQ